MVGLLRGRVWRRCKCLAAPPDLVPRARERVCAAARAEWHPDAPPPPGPLEIEAMVDEALAEDAAEVQRRLDGAPRRADPPLLFSSEVRLDEVRTPELCGQQLDGTVFMPEAIGGYPKPGGSGQGKRASKRQESQAGAKRRHGKAKGET